MPEGEMSKLRLQSYQRHLYPKVQKLNVGEVLLLGKAEEIMGGRKRPSILADAVEAIIGYYIDRG